MEVYSDMLHHFNRGQPQVYEREAGPKYFMYESFCGDGTCLPPVIFSPNPIPLPEPNFSSMPAFIHYVPNDKAPSEYTTKVYLEDMTKKAANYFQQPAHVILDSLPGHFTPSMKEEWESQDITTHRIPSAAGKWLNPCDNAINSEIRRVFHKLVNENPNNKLENIIRAYYAVSEHTIKQSFHHCGIWTGNPRGIVRKLACAGFRANKQYQLEFTHMTSAFWHWLQK